jgi:hypothetical protein
MKKAFVLGVIVLSFVAATTHAGINDGLVAYYPFNGNADDQSGNGNHGGVYLFISCIVFHSSEAADYGKK